MGIEIEKKFLLRNDGWKKLVRSKTCFQQGYLGTGGLCSMRVRIGGGKAFLNLKSAELGMKRMEYEYPLPLEDAHEILSNLCEKPIIEKTRHIVLFEDMEWEIDIFEGDNAGLEVAEIELEAEDQGFVKPDWIGEEVTNDKRYYNICLMDHPYKEW